MSGKPGLSGGMMAGAAAAAVAVAGGAGWLFWRTDPTPAPPPAAPLVAAVPPPAAAPPTPAAAPSVASPAAPEVATASPAAPQPEVAVPAPEVLRPTFDTFRHGRDGSAVVAGTAPGAAEVAVLVDGAEVARAAVDRSGRFAALFTLAPAPQARAMVLRAHQPDGSGIDSAASLVIAPMLAGSLPPPGPVPEAAVAAAAPEPAAPPPEAAPAPAAAPSPTEVAAAGPEAVVAAPAPAIPAQPQPAPAAAPAPGPQNAPPVAAVTPDPAAPLAGPPAAPAVPAPPEVAAIPAPPSPRPDPAPAPVQPANLLVSDSGVSVLRPTPDLAMVIDSISYSSAGAVQVAGKGGAGALVRLYLDNVAQFDTLADDFGAWAGTLPPVTPGIYTLRADQIDPAGKVLARSETPFLREAPEALAAVAARAETAGAAPAEVVTVQPGYTLWGIARQTYGEGVLYVKVFEANRDQIRNPDLIYPGQVFALPQGN